MGASTHAPRFREADRHLGRQGTGRLGGCRAFRAARAGVREDRRGDVCGQGRPRGGARPVGCL
eukprot:4829450-Prymnesium_polylepis.3